jgi:hypothetical protein
MEESQGNKIDLFLLSRQVDELCSQIGECGIPYDTKILEGVKFEAE